MFVTHRNFGPKTLALDRARAQERVDVHFERDPRRAVDLLRCCMQADSIDELGRLSALGVGDVLPRQGSSGEILAVYNRFAEPAPDGFRDLKFVVRLAGERMLSTVRIVHPGMYEAQLTLLPHVGEMHALAAVASLRQRAADTYFVVVGDNFNHSDWTSRTLIFGFPSFASAKLYAGARFRELVRQLSPMCNSIDELLIAWLHFGEEITVASSGEDASIYMASSELIAHFVEGPVVADLDWGAGWADLGLHRESLDDAHAKLLEDVERTVDGPQA